MVELYSLIYLQRYTKSLLAPCLTYVLLKINTNLGCLNSLLAMEYSKSILHASNIPNMIPDMNILHGL